MTKNPGQKLKYLENEMSFYAEKKAFFIIFKGQAFSCQKLC